AGAWHAPGRWNPPIRWRCRSATSRTAPKSTRRNTRAMRQVRTAPAASSTRASPATRRQAARSSAAGTSPRRGGAALGSRKRDRGGVMAGPRPPLGPEAALDLARASEAWAAILVEGWSDQTALEALARRRGRDLGSEGVVVVPIGGASNVQRFAEALGPHGLGLRLAGLCDIAELRQVRRDLGRAGIGEGPASGADTAAEHGFFACNADLEDELIRALGTAAVERVLDAEGELASFRRFQEQPAQRGRDLHAQLRRFLGTRAGRKVRYGTLLVDALDLDRVPPALDAVLAQVRE